VTLKATVAAIYSGTPTGSVTFWYGNSNLGTGTLSGGVATLVTSALPSGTLTLKATYSGPYYFITSSGTASLLVKRTQTITFPALTSPVKYGVAPITLSATASSGLAVTYSVIGPATMDGTHTLKIIGVGTVEVKAMQVGDNGYAAATPVSHSILVGKASLTIHANNATVALDQPIPALTYTLTGFVNGDKASVVTGAPDETTTAKEGSAAGHYTIKITQGTLSAANYGGWATVNGTLTITAATSDPAPPSTSVQ
jgi:hypothetical protein